MALDSYHHGIRVTEINVGTRSLRIPSTAVIGLVATASDADATMFPLDTCALVTDIDAAIAGAGTKGTLSTVLKAIADQCRPVLVIVRIPDGTGGTPEEKAASLKSNAIGTNANGKRTGLQALLAAKAAVGVKPRILGTPGLEGEEVTAALAAVGQRLNARCYADAMAKDVTEALAYRKKFGARELMLLWPAFQRWDTNANKSVTVPASAYALGMRAAIDQSMGWHKTISNVAVNGAIGVSADVTWDLQSPDNDAGLLNAAGITTIIQEGGYRFWGSRTCSSDPLFAFESAVSTAQVLADIVPEGLMWASDKPMHPQLAKDIVETIAARLRSLTKEGYLLGGSAWLDVSVNQTSELKSGRMVIDYDYTFVPPLEDLGLRQRITDRYFGDFAALARGNTATVA